MIYRGQPYFRRNTVCHGGASASIKRACAMWAAHPLEVGRRIRAGDLVAPHLVHVLLPNQIQASAARDAPTITVPSRLQHDAPASRRSQGRCPCRGSASRTGGPTCPAPAAQCSPSLLEHTVSQDNVNSDTVCLAVADYHISMALDFALKAPAARCAPRPPYAGAWTLTSFS